MCGWSRMYRCQAYEERERQSVRLHAIAGKRINDSQCQYMYRKLVVKTYIQVAATLNASEAFRS